MNQDLYFALLSAHDAAATAQPNGSIQTAHIVYQASGSMVAALSAASLAQGGLHAPIEEARALLRAGDAAAEDARYMLECGEKVPGFGNSFYPDGDPAFFPVEAILRQQYPDLVAIIDEVRSTNLKLPPPNAAMWTAAAMEAMGMPVGLGPALFISTRVKAWAMSLLRTEQMLKLSTTEETSNEPTAPDSEPADVAGSGPGTSESAG